MSAPVADTNRRGDSESGWAVLRALAVALGLLVVGVGGALLVSALTGVAFALLQGGAVESIPTTVLLVGQVLADIVFLAVGALYARRWLGGLDFSLAGDDWRWTALGFLGAVGVLVLASGIGTVLSVEEPVSAITETYDERWSLAAFGALSVVFIPLAEEALFRGAIQQRLRGAMGRWPAIAVASLGFLTIHLRNYVGGAPLSLGLAFGSLLAVSCVLGYVYDRTDSLAVPVLAHAGYNAVAMGITLIGPLG